MDGGEYRQHLREQILAYGFEATEAPEEISVEAFFEKEIAITQRGFIAISSLEDVGVEPLRIAADQVREYLTEQAARFWEAGWKTGRCYLLLLAPSVTSPMEIYIQEGHEIQGTRVALYPVLVDLDQERLVYRDLSVIEQISLGGQLADEAEKFFQLHG